MTETPFRCELTAHVFVHDKAAYVVCPMPEQFSAGMIVTPSFTGLVNTVIENNDVEAVQVAFTVRSEVVVLGFEPGDYDELVEDCEVEGNEAVNLNLEMLDQMDAAYLYLRGTVKTGEHLYAVVSEYIEAMESKETPTHLAALSLLTSTVSLEEDDPQPQSRAGSFQA